MHRELTPVTEHEHHCKFLAILFLIAAVHLLRSRGLSFTARPVAPHDASIGTCIYRGELLHAPERMYCGRFRGLTGTRALLTVSPVALHFKSVQLWFF
jgi:hypothetical protein